MSWLRFFFLGDLGQQVELHKAHERLERIGSGLISARGATRRQNQRLEALEREALQLEAGFAAVVQVLRDKGIVTQAELERALGSQLTAAEKRVAQRAAVAAATEKKRDIASARRRVERRRRES